MLTNFINTIRERKYFYIISYVITNILCLISTGIPNLYYLNPIKLLPLLSSYFIGTAFYLLYSGEKKAYVVLYFVKPMLYLLALAVIVGVFIKPGELNQEILEILIGV